MPSDHLTDAGPDTARASAARAADHHRMAAIALLRWYAEMGVDEAVADAPRNAFAAHESEPFQLDVAEPMAARRGPSAGPDPSGQPDTPGARHEVNRRDDRAQRPARSAGRDDSFDDLREGPARAAPARPTSVVAGGGPSTDEAVQLATRLAAGCSTIGELANAIAGFDGCPLKKGARSTVVYDGTLGVDLLVIGEAPGREEDQAGKPFVGRAGQLLDRMLAAIGRDRAKNTLISNVVYWRPPGNRTPTDDETMICKPFVDRFIALSQPKAIAIMGGVALKALTGQSGITRARGRWRNIEVDGREIPALALFHPAFLLRRPENKRLAWADLQALDARLRAG